jgi:hypothetical protein
MKRIIYKTERINSDEAIEGGVAVIIPSDEYLADHTIEELAAKDVPDGKAYQIIDEADVPSDRTFRNAWEYAE